MIAVLACTASNAQAQLIAGRTNALLWGNLTPNFSLELVTSNRTSVMAGAFYSLDQNPLDCSHQRCGSASEILGERTGNGAELHRPGAYRA
mgnify:CR=1 FL=1